MRISLTSIFRAKSIYQSSAALKTLINVFTRFWLRGLYVNVSLVDPILDSDVESMAGYIVDPDAKKDYIFLVNLARASIITVDHRRPSIALALSLRRRLECASDLFRFVLLVASGTCTTS